MAEDLEAILFQKAPSGQLHFQPWGSGGEAFTFSEQEKGQYLLICNVLAYSFLGYVFFLIFLDIVNIFELHHMLYVFGFLTFCQSGLLVLITKAFIKNKPLVASDGQTLNRKNFVKKIRFLTGIPMLMVGQSLAFSMIRGDIYVTTVNIILISLIIYTSYRIINAEGYYFSKRR